MTTSGRVVVVGLGPAGADLVTPAARDALIRCGRRYVRTARHPAVDDLRADGITLESFDDRYEEGSDLDAVYTGIVEILIAAAAEHGEVAYAVPGSPGVAERTVVLLHEAARAGRVTIELIAGLSFADIAWTRLGVDPMGSGARLADARDLDGIGASAGPMLIAQCDNQLVLSDLKVTLLDHLPPDTPVTVLARLGLTDEDVREVALADLDRVVTPDHLTSVFVPAAPSSATEELARLLALAEQLRGPGGCPWDAEQTHHSLTRYLLEESYEVVEAVERLPADAPDGVAPDDPAYVALVDELGDLLYQVIFHAVLAEEAGAFGMAEIARGIHDKLVHRHPHVFGDVAADTSDAVMANWEQIKKQEKGAESIVAGITPGLPSLLYAHKLMRKAASVGLDPGDVDRSLERIDAATASLRVGGSDAETTLGELLAASVALARGLGVDTESALRGWAARFRERFEAMERLAIDRDLDLATLTVDDVEALWAEVAMPA
ncbi:MAG: nucleoside triphosphate pyrophosphohydrolase [Acidimicrobiia bacterium]|nr:nucleoside triphosphate pyrophosphohydrolase [Acidimicrobiia bacterium]